MNTQLLTTILSSIFLVLLSFHSVIGQPTYLSTTNHTSPLFEIHITKNQPIDSTHKFDINYLEKNNSNLKKFYFPLKPPHPYHLFDIVLKNIPHQSLQKIIATLLQKNKSPLLTTKTFQEIMTNLDSSKNILLTLPYDNQNSKQTNQYNHSQQKILPLTEPFSTIFPSCVILIFITIILLYTYILLIEGAEFILQVLENLL